MFQGSDGSPGDPRPLHYNNPLQTQAAEEGVLDVNVEERAYQSTLIEHTLILQDNDYVSAIKSVDTILADYISDVLNCGSFIENYKKYKSCLNKYHV